MADTSNCGCGRQAEIDSDQVKRIAPRIQTISGVHRAALGLTNALLATCPESCSHRNEVEVIAAALNANWDSYADMARKCLCSEVAPGLRKPIEDLHRDNLCEIRGILDRTCPETCARREKVSKIVSAMITLNVRFFELSAKCHCQRAEEIEREHGFPPESPR